MTINPSLKPAFFRFPQDLHDKIEKAAAKAFRSKSAEVNMRLRRSFGEQIDDTAEQNAA